MSNKKRTFAGFWDKAAIDLWVGIKAWQYSKVRDIAGKAYRAGRRHERDNLFDAAFKPVFSDEEIKE